MSTITQINGVEVYETSNGNQTLLSFIMTAFSERAHHVIAEAAAGRRIVGVSSHAANQHSPSHGVFGERVHFLVVVEPQ